MNVIGHVVHFAGERNGGAYVSKQANAVMFTASAMMSQRPHEIVCIEPVDTIPEWVER